MQRCDIDEVDAAIIAVLDEDVRSTYRALAKKVGVDQVTIRRRLKKLTDSGVLRLGALLDYSKIGPSLNALFGLNTGSHDVDSVLQQVSELPDISWVASVTGRFDLMGWRAFHRMTSWRTLSTRICGLSRAYSAPKALYSCADSRASIQHSRRCEWLPMSA